MDHGIPSLTTIAIPTTDTQPVAVELTPAPSPWSIAKGLSGWPHLIFLDSADRHPDRGRYSYVTADPLEFRSHFVRGFEANPLATESAWLAGTKFEPIPDLPPFQGGVAGLFGYGLGRAFERIAAAPYDEFRIPDISTGVYDWVFSFDHQTGRAFLVATGVPGESPAQRQSLAQERIGTVLAAVREGTRMITPGERRFDAGDLFVRYSLPGSDVHSNFDPATYREVVARAVEYIRAGDCFQVNVSQRLLAPLRDHPLDLYGRLRTRNPAPFAGYFDGGDFQVLSASPERFLHVDGGDVETRPIKGTRPRGRTPAEDAAQVFDLTNNPKDRAENVMIVDLLRNDLGRVCEFGSVRVTKVCEVETFRHIHHLVSEVRGRLPPGKSAIDLLGAGFPGGSVTGTPKVRAMEIIAELEPTARGPYCGCLGFLGFNGTMDTSILIRTFTARGGWVQFPVGGGVVADSDPGREYDETLHKAAGMLHALS